MQICHMVDTSVTQNHMDLDLLPMPEISKHCIIRVLNHAEGDPLPNNVPVPAISEQRCPYQPNYSPPLLPLTTFKLHTAISHACIMAFSTTQQKELFTT